MSEGLKSRRIRRNFRHAKDAQSHFYHFDFFLELKMDKFRKLGLIEPIVRAIEEERFTEPSEIQAKAIPLILEGKDIIAGSATGSGKTFAFGAGIIQHCERGKGVQALVLTPTRELAEQIAQALKKFSKYKPLNFLPVYGGVSINPQIDALHRTEVVIATPGRLLDHLERNTIDLRKVKILVLDEADRMFDMGFIDDVEKIIDRCPKQRQTLLFSATISQEVSRIAQHDMNKPLEISVDNQVDPKKLTQVYYDVPDNQKFSLLVHLLKSEQVAMAMVFCNTQRNTDFVAKNLKINGIDAVAIHGGFSQAKRTRTMELFHKQKFYVLVCTDVAARGIDIQGISHVYNYDLPKESKQYIHRIGRTARAGKDGKAISILSSRDYDNFTRVLKENEVDIKNLELPKVERAKIVRMEEERPQFGHGGFGRSRPGRDNRRDDRGDRSNRDTRRGDDSRRDFGRGGSRGEQKRGSWRDRLRQR